MLLVFFLINPLIVGSVYIGFLLLRAAAKSIRNKQDRFWALLIAALFIAFIAPMFFAVFPGALFCIAFAGLLTWVFYPHDKRHVQTAKCDQRPLRGAKEDIIDVEVISSQTFYCDEK